MNVDVINIFIFLIMASSFGRLSDSMNHRMPLELNVYGPNWHVYCPGVDSIVVTLGPFQDLIFLSLVSV